MTDALHLVERHIIRCDDPRFAALDEACFHAKNVYNAANYELRQTYFTDQRRISYAAQEKHFKQADLLPDQRLPAKVVQQVLLNVHHDWDSFASAIREYKTNPAKFSGRPRLPRYKHKTKGRYGLVFTAQAVSKKRLRKGEIELSGLDVRIKTQRRDIDQVRVVPSSSHYVIEVVYTQPIEPKPLDASLYAGVDVGVDVLAALTSNKPGFQPVLVNGSPLKALNQDYNRRMADLRRRLPEGVFSSRRLDALTFGRNRRIDGLLHLASAFIIQLLVNEGIGTLIIGKNDGWKQAVNLGRATNQNFVNLPHARFVEMLSYKAKRASITVILHEENHTSKCSFLDNEPVEHHEQYAGKRVKRGLFRASDGRTIQADLNAAYNLIRKVIPYAFVITPVIATHARRLNPKAIEMHLREWKHKRSSGPNAVPTGT